MHDLGRHFNLLGSRCYTNISEWFKFHLPFLHLVGQPLREHLGKAQQCCLKRSQLYLWRCCFGLSRPHALTGVISYPLRSSSWDPRSPICLFVFLFLIRAFPGTWTVSL